MSHKKSYWSQFVVFIGVLSLSHVLAASSMTSTKSKRQDFQGLVLHYVNQYRAKYHLKPLKMNRYASSEAYRHSLNMAHKKIAFGHEGFSGRYKRLYHSNKNCQGASENVAYYPMDAKKLVRGWMSSPGHRRNILGHYNQTGIGIVSSSKKGWGYMTQIFLQCRGPQ